MKGGEVVEKAIEAMRRIEESSQKIDRINSVIDEVAFQTNLLALNAESKPLGQATRAGALRSLLRKSGHWRSDVQMRPRKSHPSLWMLANRSQKVWDSWVRLEPRCRQSLRASPQPQSELL